MALKRLFVFAGLWIALLASVPARPADFTTENYIYRVVTVVDNLKDPWSLAFLPDGSMLITERPGRLRILRDGKLDPEPISGTPAVRYLGQGGLLDVVLHPHFEHNQLIYLSYSKPNADRV